MKTKSLKIHTAFLMLVTLVSFTSCITGNVFAKKETNYIPYYLKVYEADSLFITRNYQKSYEILDDLFKKYEPQNIEGYYEYSNYLASSVMSGHTKGIDKKIRMAFLNFGGIGTFHEDFPQLIDTVMKMTSLPKKEIDTLKKQYLKGLNLDLRRQLERMVNEDQSVRNDNNLEGMNSLQQKHRKELDEIFKKYGYPTTKLIGSNNDFDNSVDLHIFFLHLDEDGKQKYLPILLDCVKKGKCLPEDYAIVYDRRICDNEGGWKVCKQYYGAYLNKKGEADPPVQNPQKIDSIRESIGLPHAGYSYWRNKMVNGN